MNRKLLWLQFVYLNEHLAMRDHGMDILYSLAAYLMSPRNAKPSNNDLETQAEAGA